jgi:hypothetical protein
MINGIRVFRSPPYFYFRKNTISHKFLEMFPKSCGKMFAKIILVYLLNCKKIEGIIFLEEVWFNKGAEFLAEDSVTIEKFNKSQ